jgi:pimeloyl-ACP methyl ester carboxylesterase
MTATHEGQGSRPIIRDEVLRLGPEGQLVGILSHPDGGKARTIPLPAVIVLNAGVLHRVGPHRLHVALTRRLARRGFASVRMDLGGIGDSVASSDAPTFRESAVADTRAAMTSLGEALGAHRFVIFGVCAGADNAIATALADERVGGIVLVDAAVYATPRSMARELRRQLGLPGGAPQALRWAARLTRNRLRRDLARVRRGLRAEPPTEGRENPPLAAFRSQLRTLADRGVRVLSIYAGIHGENYNHDDQLYELFPELRGRIDRAYFPEANHTFTQLADQAALIDATEQWIASEFG